MSRLEWSISILYLISAAIAPCPAAAQNVTKASTEYVLSEAVTTRSSLSRDSALNWDDANCVLRRQDTRQEIPELFAFIRCMTSLKAGMHAVAKIVEETRHIPEWHDYFRSYEVLVELDPTAIGKTLHLPSPDVKVFYSNCRHAWVSKTGCTYGTDAAGTIEIEGAGDRVVALVLDLEIGGTKWKPSEVGESSSTGDKPVKLLKRAPLGE